MKPEAIDDDLLDGMFRDYRKNQNRTDDRRHYRYIVDIEGNVCYQSKRGIRRVGGGVACSGALLALGTIGIYAQDARAASAISDDSACQRIAEAVRLASCESSDSCRYCELILSISPERIEQCGIAVMNTACDLVDSAGGLVAWNAWHENWEKLRNKCKEIASGGHLR
jgi:hypothetical protein